LKYEKLLGFPTFM